MKTKVHPVVLSILVCIILLVSFVKDSSFSDSVYVSKYYYFLFFAFPLLFVFIIKNLNAKREITYELSYLDLSVISFFCYSLVRSYFSSTQFFPHPEIIDHFILVVIYWNIKISLRLFSVKEIKVFSNSLFLGLLLILLGNSIWGTFQLIGISKEPESMFKIVGGLGNPGPFSIFLVGLVSVAFAVIFFRQQFSKVSYRISIVSLFFTVLLLPFAKSRTAWLCFVVILFCFLWKRIKKSNWLKKIMQKRLIFLSGVVSVLILLILSSCFLWRLKEDSASGRLFIWKLTSQIIADKSLGGHGYDSFTHTLNDYQASFFANPQNSSNNAARVADNATFAFNEYLQIVAEIGIIGLVLYGLVFFFAFYEKRNRRTGNDKSKTLRLAARAILVVVLLSSFFSYSLHVLPILILFYIALGIIAGTTSGSVIEFSGNRAFSKIGILFLAFLLAVIFSLAINRFSAEKEWNKLQKINRVLSPEIMYEKYSELEPIMGYNEYFMFNFGAELIYAKKYRQGIIVLKKTLPRLNDSNIYIYLGHAYDELGDFDNAEYCFKHASLIVPAKIYPLYSLVKLYQRVGREDEAKILAKKILSKGEKVETPIGNGIMIEMNQYLHSKMKN